MAVQAQYPSNVLLLNRSVQDGKNQLGNDYSLQPQPGGASSFLDQPPLLFNHGGGTNSTRKRGREINSTASPMNTLMSMQPQTHLIDLTQLHTPPPNAVSTGLKLAFGDQQQLNQQRQEPNSHSPQSSQSSVLLSIISDDLGNHIQQQRDEIDHFLQAQGEQLRRTLAEKRHRHYRALLGAAEEAVVKKLREKEVQVEKAARRNAELEARAAQLSAEAQAWQARARAQEAQAATLQAQIQQAMMMNRGGGNGAGGGCNAHYGDREEGSGGLMCAGGEAEDAESAYVDPDRVEVVAQATEPSCKACRKRIASVVLLPCRHLCLCTECDVMAQACPLCLSFRSSSIEVFLC